MQYTDPLIGQQFGNYLLQHSLGRGGMARVYKGLDVTLKRPVAIKVIAEDLRMNTAYGQRFEREAQSVANLKHPNIVTIFHFGNQNGMYYMVMEYIDGADLDAIMRNYENNGELMPHADVIRILGAVGSALDYAHAQGVIHRDIKPSNIMLERDGRPVLTDFGLALRLSEGTVGDTFGSPHYISPEQARNSANAVAGSDIYSLGVVAYELLAGVVPFDDPNPTALAMQHIMAEVPSVRAFNRELSPQVDAVLLKALAKTPHERYPTSAAFVETLAHALDSLKQAPQKVATADLPPLPPGVTPPPPRRLSMQTARDKLAQELALQAAKGQALTHGPITVPQRTPKAISPQQSTLIPFAVAGFIAFILLIIVGSALLGLLNRSPAIPTVAVLPSNLPNNLPTDPPTNLPSTVTSAATISATTEQTVSTSTDLPTPIPTSTLPPVLPTIAPTVVPTVIPTIATAVSASTAAPSAMPTLLYPDGLKFIFLYSTDALYMANQSGQRVLVAYISFDRMLTNGLTSEHFDGARWAGNYVYIEPNKCVTLKITGSFAQLPTADCPYGLNSEINAQKREMFWTPTDNSTEFRVLWKAKEIARCQIGQGRCEVRFPTK